MKESKTLFLQRVSLGVVLFVALTTFPLRDQRGSQRFDEEFRRVDLWNKRVACMQPSVLFWGIFCRAGQETRVGK